jgi:hypothetical protein
MMNAALERCKNAGFAWGYGAVAYQNRSSIRGIHKEQNWAYIGRLLLRHSMAARYWHIVAATIENPSLTRLVP